MNPTQKNNFMPDTIPFKVAELPNGEAGTVQATDVDNEARVAMNLNEDGSGKRRFPGILYGEFANLTRIEVYYGVVTKVEGDTIT